MGFEIAKSWICVFLVYTKWESIRDCMYSLSKFLLHSPNTGIYSMSFNCSLSAALVFSLSYWGHVSPIISLWGQLEPDSGKKVVGKAFQMKYSVLWRSLFWAKDWELWLSARRPSKVSWAFWLAVQTEVKCCPCSIIHLKISKYIPTVRQMLSFFSHSDLHPKIT